jgi:hypothetical protein
MNSTITNLQWFSTPLKEVVYELINQNLNRTFMISMETTSTRNTTLKPSQEDQVINLKE